MSEGEGLKITSLSLAEGNFFSLSLAEGEGTGEGVWYPCLPTRLAEGLA